MPSDQHDFHGLLHSADLIEAELRRKLAPLGLLPRQARVLHALSQLGPVSQSNLALAFGVTPASMSTMADRLLTAGYITRIVDPDSRRQNILDLTDSGHTQLAGITLVWTEVDDISHGVLGREAVTLFELARRLRDGLGGAAPETRAAPRTSD